MVIKGVFDKISVYNQNNISNDKESPLKNKEKAPDIKDEPDKVELSSHGKLLNQLIEVTKDKDIVRKDKVEDLKDKISKGEYKVDSKKVAEKMVESEIDLYL